MNFFWRDFFFGLKWGTPDGHLRHSHFVGPRGDKDAPSCAGIVLSSAKIHWYWAGNGRVLRADHPELGLCVWSRC
jgi:hypothetical protein